MLPAVDVDLKGSAPAPILVLLIYQHSKSRLLLSRRYCTA